MVSNTQDKKSRYLALREQMTACTKCPLRAQATQVVPGTGNINAEIMFIGEGPGANEDKQGLPFVGAAGKFLDQLLASIDLDRNQVFIANMVKCRPPQNRDPTEEEKKICAPWLDQQIDIIQPEIFIPLGRHAMSKFIPGRIISQEHGNAYIYNGRTFFISYHPAVALYNGSMRSVMLEDFQKLRSLLDHKLKPQNLDDGDKYTQSTVEEIMKLKKESTSQKPKPSPPKATLFG